MRQAPVQSRHLSVFVCTLLGGLFLSSTALADVKPSPYFQDHAVLQAGKAMPIWGKADAGEKVTVSFAGQTASTTAEADGKWRVSLKPLKVNAEAATLTITGNNTIVIKNVVVGDVWLCAGQSNMDFKVSQVTNASAEIASAERPLIRQFNVYSYKSLSNTPLDTAAAGWAVSSPKTVGEFTAVGYFFAREVNEKLGVPVGIINTSWGGTEIEAWIPSEAVAGAEFKFIDERWQQLISDYPAKKLKYDAEVAEEEAKFAAAAAKGEVYKKKWLPAIPNPDGTPHRNKLSNIYNAMVHPFTAVPLSGILWYQGESNAGRHDEYSKLFPALIKGWRTAFAQPDLPFYWVQLPNFRATETTNDWVKLRVAQSSALSLPKTAQAITIDVGEVKDIHPKNKQDVGHRLALIALKNHYGKDVIASGPTVAKISFSKDSAMVKFKDLAGGLQFKGDALTGFEIAGEDKVFKPAEASISGDTVTVKSAEIPAPVAVRYAWRNAPQAALYNKADLPAAPFRSDAW
jgi:sialate O-acetylesterase